ncbi:hypothetical protein K438DRAFT_1783327 [Mycena galopus ATCC 62051]|nr:hypothetical protein K438DRAFT_1783327 [Mycena galopus ATCC 62051]
MFAREHVKKRHKGRETRGVLTKSTAQAIGFSTKSILGFVFGSVFLFFLPVLASALTLLILSYHLSSPWSCELGLGLHYLCAPDIPGLIFSVYFYWVIACQFFLYRIRPNAFNTITYQTFNTPWHYRRDHTLNMRLDRLQRAWHGGSPLSGAPKKKDPPQEQDSMTVFVDTAGADTIALTVTPETTVSDIRATLCHRGYTACCNQGPIYLSHRK